MALDMSTQMRLTGMASGLDTDAVIQNLGKVHTLRINKVKQDKQLAIWRQEMYRDTISKLSNFMKSNLNVSNPASNFRSSAAFAKFSYSIKGKVGGIDASEFLSVTANGDLRNFSQTVQAVTQLATKDTYAGKVTDLQGITTKGFSYEKLGIYDSPNGLGGTFKAGDTKYANIGISIDGTSRTILISPEELTALYNRENMGGYNKIVGSARESAIDDFENNGSLHPGQLVRKEDGSYGGITKAEIYKWYETELNKKFADQDNPTPAEEKAAIGAYFAEHAIYDGSGGAYGKLGDAAKDAAMAGFIADGTSPSGIFVYNGFGYEEVGEDDIYEWYTTAANLGGGGGTFVDPNAPDTTERQAAIEVFFGANNIYEEGTTPGRRSTTALAAFLSDKIEQLYGGDFKNVVSVTANGELKFQKDGSTITLFEQTGFDTVGKGMGLSGGASTAGAVNNTKMADLLKDFNLGGDGFWDFEGLGGVPITINGVSVMVTKEDTVGTFMAKLNGSEAGVTLSYTASTNSFTLTSKLEGTANAIKLENPITQFFFGAAFGMDENTRTEAQNFKGTINGVEYVRQSNSFTHEGMTFTFNKVFDASADPIKIEVSKNTSEIVTGIKAFVEEYNKLVTHINDLLKGKRDRDYPPLTDDDRKAMKDEEIKLYEEKAKGGLLANDAQLRKLLNDMRAALYQKVEGVGLTMADIGITTSPNYMDGGTLVIDENKLSAALDKNYDGVVSLFTKSSSIPAWEKDSSKLAKRASESGIAQRLNDILTAAAGTSTTGDKGYLLQKAGAVNDRTQYDNSITKQVNEYDKKIDQLLEKWYRQENTYYMMFARMETAMSKLQAQQNSLAQIMAQSGK